MLNPLHIPYAGLRDLFNTPVMPRKPLGRKETIAPALFKAGPPDANGKPTRIEIAPPLVSRPLGCDSCANTTGMLVRVGEGVYRHQHCKPGGKA